MQREKYRKKRKETLIEMPMNSKKTKGITICSIVEERIGRDNEIEEGYNSF